MYYSSLNVSENDRIRPLSMRRRGRDDDGSERVIGLYEQLVKICKWKFLGAIILFGLGLGIFCVGVRWRMERHPGGFPFLLLGGFVLVPGTYGVYEVNR
jgi:hypothetical protein